MKPKINFVIALVLLLVVQTRVHAQQESTTQVENESKGHSFMQRVNESVYLTVEQQNLLQESLEKEVEIKKDSRNANSKSSENHFSEYQLNSAKQVLNDQQLMRYLISLSEEEAKEITLKSLSEIKRVTGQEQSRKYEEELYYYFLAVAVAKKRYAYEPEILKENLYQINRERPLVLRTLDEAEEEKKFKAPKEQVNRKPQKNAFKGQYEW